MSSAQTASIALSSGSAPASGSVALNLTLSGGSSPAGLQWKFTYSPSDFTAMNIAAGANATAASKSLSCFGSNGSYTCLLTGINANKVNDGVVATATLTLSSSATTVSRSVAVSDTMAVSVTGGTITSAGTGSIVTLSGPAPDTQAPTAPGSLSASSASGTLVNLSWGASTDNAGVTGYRIERCQGAGCTGFAQIGTSTGTAYGDSGLSAGTAFRYRVRATDAAGNLSGYSPIASVTTPLGSVLSNLACSPDSLVAPGSTNCTVTLTSAAPSGGASISLTSSHAGLSVPGTITIAAGGTTGGFAATAAASASGQTALITADWNGVSQTSSVSVLQSGVISVFPPNAVPSVITDSDTAAVELGMKVRSSVPGNVMGVRFYKGPSNTGTHTGSLWTSTGTLMARVTFAGETASGWQQANFSNPVPIAANTTYVISYQAPVGRYSANNNYFVQNGVDNAPLRALKDGEDGSNGVYIYGPSAFPSQTWQGTNYWVDVVFSPQGQAALPVLSSLVCSPSSLSSNAGSVCSATLSGPAPSGGAVLSVSDNNSNLNVPATTTVAAGATSGTFTATAGNITSDQSAVVTAAYNGTSVTAALSLVSTAAQISALACSPSNLTSGNSAACTVTLTKAATAGGALVAVSDNNVVLAVPASVTIAAGATSGTFAATAGTVTIDQVAVVTATYGGASRTSSISLVGAAAQISGLTCSPSSLASGQAATCTVTLTKGAPAGGTAVAISDDNASLSVPASMTVAAGATTGTFTATAANVTSDQTATVTVSSNGGSKSATVALTAPSAPSSIWSSSASPAVIDSADTASVELGVKLRSSVAGYVTGVRFYKATANTGTHVGTLWSNTGSALAKVTFSNETASGWQQASFTTPVAISANTTYVVSYLAPRGRYSIDTGFFAGSGATNGTLTALKDGADGGNSVFRYGSGGFPNGTWKSSNYWVDVVFTAEQLAPLSSKPGKRSVTMASAGEASDHPPQATPNRELSGPALSCHPRIVRAGDSFQCVAGVDGDMSTQNGSLAITASGSDVRLPARINYRAGQRSITFHGSIDQAASQSVVEIGIGNGDSRDRLTVVPAGAPVLSAPEAVESSPGELVAFTVSARDGENLAVAISASRLPEGATFDPATNHFSWMPPAGREGNFTVSYQAVNLAGSATAQETRIAVASRQPKITATAGVTCAAGSPLTLRGQGLSILSLADRTGLSLELGGTTVRSGGTVLPILSVNPSAVEVLCPSSSSSDQFSLVLETEAGVSSPVTVTLVRAKPVLLSVDGATEGDITVDGTDRLAIVRDVRNAGEPAQKDDVVVIRAAGLGNEDHTESLAISVNGVVAKIQSVRPDPSAAGIVQIRMIVSEAAGIGNAVPVQATLRLESGKLLTSNTVTMAVE